MTMADIMISGTITESSAFDVCARIGDAWKYYRYDEVTLRISSPGGDTVGMSRILREIDRCQRQGITVRTLCVGPVASAAAVIASAGSLGHRDAWSEARLLYHEPRAMGRRLLHTADALIDLAGDLGATQERMLEGLLCRIPGSASGPGPTVDLRELPQRLRGVLREARASDGPMSLRDAYALLLRLDIWITPEEACALRLLDRCLPFDE